MSHGKQTEPPKGFENALAQWTNWAGEHFPAESNPNPKPKSGRSIQFEASRIAVLHTAEEIDEAGQWDQLNRLR